MRVNPREAASIGQILLQEAVLEVLCNLYPEGCGPKEVSESTGINRLRPTHDNFAMGLLQILEEQGKVEHLGHGKWHVSQEEYNRRRPHG